VVAAVLYWPNALTSYTFPAARGTVSPVGP
jgi:hypothetical protein